MYKYCIAYCACHTYATHTVHYICTTLEVWPWPYNQLVLKWIYFTAFVSVSCSLTGRVSFSSSHHRTLQTAIKTEVLRWLCMGRESWERKKREMRGGMSVGERKKGIKRGSMRGKMYSTTSPSKPRLILCLLIFITIAASCKMFDGFVQILVPLIHNYCYTCRTKGNFRRGAVWKAAARL